MKNLLMVLSTLALLAGPAGANRFEEDAAKLEAALESRIAAAKRGVAASPAVSAPAWECLFGGDLVQMARMRDLEVGPERKLRPGAALTAIERRQLVDGIGAGSPLEAFDLTDDKEFLARDVRDTAHGREFVLYVYHGGDNAHGFIYEKGTLNRVAELGDGAFQACTVGFGNYAALPWFYSN